MYRQALWFAQRAAEQERETVFQQLQSTGLPGKTGHASPAAFGWQVAAAIAGLTAPLAPPASAALLPTTVRSEDVLDQLTQRITGIRLFSLAM